jgi:exoribonuclease R
MPRRHIRLGPSEATTSDGVDAALRARFAAIRAELEVDGDFPGPALAEAADVAAHPVGLPARDETEVPFFTLDPVGSLDLDQAMCLERDGGGYRVRYAVADLSCFVRPDGALDAEVRRRGETVYCPDERVPLHPVELSEGAASLLPSRVRPAYVWDLRLGAEGDLTATDLYRAMVRSIDRLDYPGVQGAVDGGSRDERFVLLREIGERRIRQEELRGGASLPMPEQEVHEEADGRFTLDFRPPRAAEEWNAQISLMTGMAAADLMLHAGVGVLRTMPAPDPGAIRRLRRQATALGAGWPAEEAYGDFIRDLDRTNPRHLALIHAATSLFRGAGYTPFDGAVPERIDHAAVADAYAHVTAPLRRLVDRFGLVVCEAITGDSEVPAWVRLALPTLPALMTHADRRTRAVERAGNDAVQAAILFGRVGETFTAVVVDVEQQGRSIVQLTDLPILAEAEGEAHLGAEVTVRVESADITAGRICLSVA